MTALYLLRRAMWVLGTFCFALLIAFAWQGDGGGGLASGACVCLSYAIGRAAGNEIEHREREVVHSIVGEE